MLRRSAIIAALVLGPALASAESLGEAARRAREHHKPDETATSSAKVFTESDLKSNKGELAISIGAPSASEPTAAASVVAPSSRSAPEVPSTFPRKAGTQGSEQSWREEARRRREAVARLEALAQNQGRWTDPTYVGADGPACPITRRKVRASVQQQLAEARESLARLEDDARTARALPGWIRE